MDWQNAQYTVKNERVFLYAVTMLIFQIKELFQVKNGLTTSLLFSKMPKIWVGRTTINGEKKEDGLILTGKRDSRRRHYTTNFSENDLVAETSYQMLEVLPFCERETA